MQQLGHKIGSGIYVPQGRWSEDEIKIPLDPAGEGCTKTINRAELAPIHYVLEQNLGDVIASDSACSLYQIARYIRNPMSMQRHKHKHLLEAIVQLVRRNGRPVQLIKVKAHTGIVGNEIADEIAKQASGMISEGASIPTCAASGCTPYYNMHWPTQVTAVAQGEQRIWQPDNLGASLKAKLRTQHRLGYANTDGIYYSLWAKTVDIADGPLSNAFITDKGSAGLPRTLTLQARYGQLNTGKFRHRAKLASTAKCKLCNQPDGGHHSLSGCPHMTKMYTARHNKAAAIICNAVRKGRLGASLIMQDVGTHNVLHAPDRHEEPIEHDTTLGTRIPGWVYTTGLRKGQRGGHAETWNRYRPDLLIVTNREKPVDSREVRIVEVKYCQDTSREPQQLKGECQHEALKEALVAIGYDRTKVSVSVITLGVTGTIYKDMLQTLGFLGVQRWKAMTCARKLHLHAVGYVSTIMTTKWAQERVQTADKVGVG